MRLEMIDGDEGLAARQRQRLARHEPDEHAADEARARRGRDAVEVLEPQSRPRPAPAR